MTGRALNVSSGAILCFALLCALYSGAAAEAPATDQPATATQSPVLTNAEQVHWLSRKEAAGKQRVLIRGVITVALGPEFNAAVVQDETGGIYVDLWTPPLGPPPPVGEFVEVEGVTDPGQFAPLIHATRIVRHGTRELPTPVRPYWDQLINGSLDTAFVEVEGIVTTVQTNGVTLLTHGGKINTLIFDANGKTNNLSLKPYQGALIRLRGCLFASWDRATHQVNVSEIRMFAPAVDVAEPAPADAFAIPPKGVADLLQFDPQASALRRVKVSGQIVQEHEGEFYAMDGTNGFRFAPRENAPLDPGDMVEVVGFPGLTGPSPVLREAVVRKIGAAPLPIAHPLSADNLFRAENDGLRVRVNAVLLNLSGDQQTLELQSGLKHFAAHLHGGRLFASTRSASARSSRARDVDLPLGSQLELTGVYSGSGGNRATGTEVANFELLLNSPADIRVLVRPSFWNLQRMLVLVAALLGVLTLAFVWIWLLRLKVQQRTTQLQKEVQDREKAEQQRTVAQERARIARDLHDDLGSSLTEITMLATANPGARLAAEDASERMQTIADKSRTMVYALDELVWAVDPERDTLGSVARYLASYAEEYLAGLKIACRVQIPNSFPEQVVSGEVRHHLFLAVKEALNNAVRHGTPTEVGFRVRVLEDRLLISISDNGSGFDTLERSNGHGLLNLRSRLEHLHGQCELESSPGAGTTVSLQLPIPVPNTSA
jgi:signal transduction histidine kinase